MRTTAIVTSLTMMLALATATATAAQASTAFTYQGQLKLDGVPLSNTVDINFTLYNASSNGIVIGSPVFLTDVDVANGLFTVQLDFGASAFDGEARWLDIEIRSPAWDGQGPEPAFTPLHPRQQLTATPYAMHTRGINIDESGRVGIGTTSPTYPLEVSGAIAATSLRLFPAAEDDPLIIAGFSSPANYIDIQSGKDPYGTKKDLRITTGRHPDWNGNQIRLRGDGTTTFEAGNVGIGTASPAFKLDVAGMTRVEGALAINESDTPELQFHKNGSTKWRVGSPTGSADFMIMEGGVNESRLGISPGGNIKVASDLAVSGKVGIGTNNPAAKLDVSGSIVAASSNPSEGVITATVTHSLGLDDAIVATTPGNLNGNSNYIASLFKARFSGGGSGRAFTVVKGDDSTTDHVTATISADGNAYFAGTASAAVIQIRGADVAEKFPVTEQVKPGMVVAIDPNSPGRLCLARGSYNRCVAGVVSGAGDLPAGAVLGNLPGHEDAPPIALTGRVWVYCDADANGPIQPGDLMTTSDTPGHAMRVSDHHRADGAVLGKAMTRLDACQGLVLVLVTLQ